MRLIYNKGPHGPHGPQNRVPMAAQQGTSDIYVYLKLTQEEPMVTEQTTAPETVTPDPEVPTFVEPHGWGKHQFWALYITCPHCGDLHTHGGGLVKDGAPDLGHRVSHCVYHPVEGYHLVPGPEDMEKPTALGAPARRRMQVEGEALTAQLRRQQQERLNAELRRQQSDDLARVGY